MDNKKLDQLTQKLYDEGLEKGRAEADRLVSAAKEQAEKVLAEARAQAADIVRQAEAKAEDVSKNTMTEIALAGKQAVAKIKSEIASAIVVCATGEGVKAAGMDAAFIKEMLVAVAKNWNGADAGKVSLQALLPEGEREKLDAAMAAQRRRCSMRASRSATRKRSKPDSRSARKTAATTFRSPMPMSVADSTPASSSARPSLSSSPLTLRAATPVTAAFRIMLRHRPPAHRARLAASLPPDAFLADEPPIASDFGLIFAAALHRPTQQFPFHLSITC